MGFGLTDREAARLSQMKRTDEPLEEEVRGLYIVGATGGLVLGPLLFGSSILGMIVGVQVGPSLAFTGGERMRATGWESWRLWGIQVRRSRRAWLIARREAEARGLTPLLRRTSGSIRAWDERTSARRRCADTALITWSLVQLAWARLAASGASRQLFALWERTTVPRRLRELQQRSVLQARIADIRRSEAGDGTWGIQY